MSQEKESAQALLRNGPTPGPSLFFLQRPFQKKENFACPPLDIWCYLVYNHIKETEKEEHESMSRMRCAISGIGHRSRTWISEVAKTYSDVAEIIALCDPVPGRCHDMCAAFGLSAEEYSDYDAMLAAARPDLVIVTSPDHVHAGQIVKAFHAGCDVASEKPLCLTPEEGNAILAAERECGKRLFMGFNYRHIPLCTRIREVILNGEIGRPVSMNLSWYLDYKGHGASYFRRWHRLMKNSGGLLITKAAHHFDLANWFFGDYPESVSALCAQNFFGSAGGKMHAARCRECSEGPACEFYSDIADLEKRSNELNYEIGAVRGYDGDRCVFSEDSDIYDTMALLVRYRNGGILSYTLDASVPFEGWNLAINGTKGRLETGITDNKPFPGWQEKFQIVDKKGRTIGGKEARVTSWPSEYTIHVMPHSGLDRLHRVPNLPGGHGGGDYRIFNALFRKAGTADDRIGVFAGALDGMASMMIGWGANRSARTGLPVRLDALDRWLPERPSANPDRPA